MALPSQIARADHTPKAGVRPDDLAGRTRHLCANPETTEEEREAARRMVLRLANRHGCTEETCPDPVAHAADVAAAREVLDYLFVEATPDEPSLPELLAAVSGRRAPRPRQAEPKHGTLRGYQNHLMERTSPCPPCIAANGYHPEHEESPDAA
ncbi:hypothetical protein [Nocardiopsis sp. NPDC057823]|uniref:hypothetical protein n=1 Tax=Nocardiopsis sp. NPDC057823 TaxID=3346256 RepID=UPI00366BB698